MNWYRYVCVCRLKNNNSYHAAPICMLHLPACIQKLGKGSMALRGMGGCCAQIGAFKIVQEAGIASGVRRIEAVVGPSALAYLNGVDGVVRALAGQLKVKPEELPARVAGVPNVLMHACILDPSACTDACSTSGSSIGTRWTSSLGSLCGVHPHACGVECRRRDVHTCMRAC